MRAVIAVGCILVFLLLPLAAQPDKYPTINYKDADEHMGEIVWVEGTVLKIMNESEGTYLCFHNNDRYLRVLVPTKYLENFEGGFKYRYVGKRVKAIGKVDKFGSQLILGINEPKRIQIIEEST